MPVKNLETSAQSSVGWRHFHIPHRHHIHIPHRHHIHIPHRHHLHLPHRHHIHIPHRHHIHIPHIHTGIAAFDKAAKWVGDKVDKGAKWLASKWNELTSVFEWAMVLIDLLVGKQTQCVLKATKQQRSMFHGHLHAILTNPEKGLQEAIPAMEKEFKRFMNLMKVSVKTGEGLLEMFGSLGSKPDIKLMDAKIIAGLEQFGKLEPAIACVLPTVKHAASNPIVNKSRQKLADHLWKFYTSIIKPAMDKILTGAIKLATKGIEKVLTSYPELKKIIDWVKGAYRKIAEESSKIVNRVLTAFEKAKKRAKQFVSKVQNKVNKFAAKVNRLRSQLLSIVDATEGKFRKFWDTKSLVRNTLEPLYDMAMEWLIQKITHLFNMMWDPLIPGIMETLERVANIAIDTLCGMGSVATEWACAILDELAANVLDWVQSFLREGVKQQITKALMFIFEKAEEYIIRSIVDAGEKALTPLYNTIDKKAKMASAALAKAKEDLDALVPKPILTFFGKLFKKIVNTVMELLQGNAGDGTRNLLQSLKGLIKIENTDFKGLGEEEMQNNAPLDIGASILRRAEATAAFTADSITAASNKKVEGRDMLDDFLDNDLRDE
jgi:hypothetical protein